MTEPALSIVVPVAEVDPLAEVCFEALAAQDPGEPWEVIAVLTEGWPGAERLERACPGLRVARCGGGAGPGGARNAGLDLARGGVVAFTDADCRVAPDWGRRLVARVRERQGGPVTGWTETAYRDSLVARASDLAEYGMTRPPRPRHIPGIWGSCIAIGRPLLETSGARFAEGVYGAEEMALLCGLPPSALPVLLDPAIRIENMHREALPGSLSRMRRLGRGSGALRRRLPLRGSPLARRPWLVPLLVPGRTLLTFGRCARNGPRALLELLLLYPLVLANWCAYCLGFGEGARSPRVHSVGR